MRVFLIFILSLFFTTLNAQDLDALLRLYKSESELSKKTKDENAGNLIIYTREDLERMQVETLQDLFKSDRYFRYIENRRGEPDPLNADPLSYSSRAIKIYLNNTELAIPIAGTGIMLFGNMEMDFIDHVEIYQGFPSFEFAIEPALVIIKLYTKTPKKDAGSRIKVLASPNGANKENIYTADISENDIRYFLYANHSDNIRDKYKLEDKTLKRDTHTNHFYGSFAKDDYKLEFNALNSKQDEFLGGLPYAVPKDADKSTNYLNTSFSAKFLQDKTLSFQASYLYMDAEYNAEYSPALAPSLGGYSTYNQSADSQAFTALLKKEYNLDKNTLSIGTQYRYKQFNFNDLKLDDVITPTSQKYNKEDIYSVFLEDAFSLTQSDLLSLSIMVQYYERNKDMKSESPLQLRLSYIKSTDSFLAKTFLSRQEFVPEPYMTAQENVGNPDLTTEIYKAVTQEFSHTTPRTFSRVTFAYTRITNAIFTSIDGVMQNSNKDTNIYAASLELKYFFRENDQLFLQADVLKLEGTDALLDSTHYNYVIRMLNSFSKLNIFNELVINKGYRGGQIAYDYSLGAKYSLTQDLHVAIRGNNIFDTGLEREYIYSLTPTTKTITVPVIEQQLMLSLEYLF